MNRCDDSLVIIRDQADFDVCLDRSDLVLDDSEIAQAEALFVVLCFEEMVKSFGDDPGLLLACPPRFVIVEREIGGDIAIDDILGFEFLQFQCDISDVGVGFAIGSTVSAPSCDTADMFDVELFAMCIEISLDSQEDFVHLFDTGIDIGFDGDMDRFGVEARKHLKFAHFEARDRQ